MASLPVDSTARLFVDYVTGTVTPTAHTLQVRYLGSDRTAAAAQARVLSVLQGLGAGALRQGWRVTAVRTALAGEGFTTPQTAASGLASFIGTGTGTYARWQEARELTFVGRGVNSPRRVRLSIFGLGPGVALLETFRYASGGSITAFNNAIAAIRAGSSPLVAIDGSEIVWYPYVNMNLNSYWERRLRAS